MAEETPDIAEQAQMLFQQSRDLLAQTENITDMLVRSWNAWQLAIILGTFLTAHILHLLISPRVHGWLHSRSDWPKWRLRIMVVLHRQIRLILFVLLIWVVWEVMQHTTWPSRSYLIGISARLATAWLAIALSTRLITNPTMRGVVRYGAWAWVTLSILGIVDQAIETMNRIGFDIGGFRISIWVIVQAVFVLALLFYMARFLSRVSATQINTNTQISPSMRVLTIKIIQVALYGAAFFLGLKAVGVDLTGLAVLSGAIGVGLGFGLQKVVSNLVSGVILLLDKSIKPGDVISLGDTFGWINTLGARYVSITTRDGREYLIPNEDLITGQVVNWSHSDEFVRLDIYFGTAYHDDPHEVRRVAIEAAAGVNRVLANKPPVCHIVGFGDSSVDYILRFWIKDPTGGLTNIRGNVYLALWDAFQAHNISIPFPQREVRMLERDTTTT